MPAAGEAGGALEQAHVLSIGGTAAIQQRQAGGGSRGGSGTHLSKVDVLLLLLLLLLGPLLQLPIRPLHNDPGTTGGARCLQTHR